MADAEEKKPEQDKQSEESDKALAKKEAEPAGSETTTPEAEPIEPEELISQIQKLPPAVRKEFQAFFAGFSHVSRPSYNPLFDKFTAAHIDKYLDYAQRDTDNEYAYKKSNRWFYLIYAIIAIAVFCAGVAFLLPKDKDLLIQLITFLVILAGGIGGGYGLSKRRPE